MLSDQDVMAVVAVKDMEAAAKYYGDTLGLSVGMESPGGT